MELYRHKVGYAYVLLHRGLQPETWEDYVIYRGLYGERNVYCLPTDRFTGSGKYTRIGKYDLTPEELTVLQEVMV